MLLDRGADPNYDGGLPLTFAILFNQPTAVKLLLAGGADRDVHNRFSRDRELLNICD